MDKDKSPKLPLTQAERAALRAGKLKLREIHKQDLQDLMRIMGVSEERARYVKAMAAFQQIPSIGYELACNLTRDLGLYSIEEAAKTSGPELFDRLEQNLGMRVDPCVEDQFRCVIYHANHPGSDKQWFDFTAERKLYRQAFGYPKSRPPVK
ncbi:helix-hairpin-helix domain-containing protein [Brevibacillus massiliensis]|uniref:helix-hairpin-helix domain-containing protein n=1 Tax=Brevibacillus massiliensis TaxID=1118054 RepID=UPI00030D6263|nr:helix-hairpin-helix domain-containing protein [Brevibacillus massiliensis]